MRKLFDKIMNADFSEYFKRFKNPGTIVALIAAIGVVLQQFGISVDQVWLNNTITAICSVLVILGIVNDPRTPGLDTPITKCKHESE